MEITKIQTSCQSQDKLLKRPQEEVPTNSLVSFTTLAKTS